MLHLKLPTADITKLCEAFHVRELSVFGSVLRDDFSEASDVDFLVEFSSDAEIGFLALSRMQRELSRLLTRKVDLVTKTGLKPLLRERIITNCQVIYAA